MERSDEKLDKEGLFNDLYVITSRRLATEMVMGS